MGPNGPVTDSAEMLVGRLGQPELGGSYYTFSNENNDLIWGFLAECHRRGWLYKGHDSMPWCPRCGTGLSQMEMNEGYQDREDPGLTVSSRCSTDPANHCWSGRRRRGRSPPTWPRRSTRITATCGSARATTPTGSGRGALKQAVVGEYRIEDREEPAPTSSGWRYDGPFDELPAVRQPSRTARGTSPASPTSTASCCGTRSARTRGRASSTSPRARRRGLPAGQGAGPARDRPHRRGRPVRRGLRLADRPRGARTSPSRSSTTWSRRKRLLPPRALHAPLPALLAMRHAAAVPARRRVVHQHGPAVRPAARDADRRAGRRQPALPDHGRRRPDPLDPGLRLRARARLAPQHARLDDQQEALLGPGAADLRVRGVRDGRGHRRPRRAPRARRRGLGRVRGTHAPPAVRRRREDRLSRLRRAGRTHQGRRQPWLDAGIVPFSTLHYREDPDYWREWFPADFITESFPGQFRNWFYSMLAMSTVLRREPPFKTIFGYALVFGEDGRPMHKSWGNAIEFDEAADRMGVDVMRWMFAKARPEENILFGWHAADEARRELLILWNVYSFFVTYARLAGWTPAVAAPPRRGSADPRSLDPVARRRDRGDGRGTGCWTSTRWGPRGRCQAYLDGLSTWYLRLSRRPVLAQRRPARPGRRLRDPPRGAGRGRSHARPDPAVPRRVALREPRRDRRARGPDSVHLTRWPSADLAPHRDAALEASMASSRAPSTLPGRCAARPTSRRGSPWPRPGWRCPIGGWPIGDELLALIADEINVKRVVLIGDEIRARRAAGQAAPAEDRQAPRVGDPRRHGRRPRGRRSRSRTTAR